MFTSRHVAIMNMSARMMMAISSTRTDVVAIVAGQVVAAARERPVVRSGVMTMRTISDSGG